MATWKEERDRLLAQTLAFVQQVAAAHPGAARKINVAPAAAATSPAPIEPDVIVVLPADHAAAVLPCVIPPGPASIIADLRTRPTGYAARSERDEIAERVAAFKARQTSLNRDRETFYETMQARIRASLRNDPGIDRL